MGKEKPTTMIYLSNDALIICFLDSIGLDSIGLDSIIISHVILCHA